MLVFYPSATAIYMLMTMFQATACDEQVQAAAGALSRSKPDSSNPEMDTDKLAVDAWSSPYP
ncbi:hypothetical protein BDA96_10G014000 [Sorghum bicolor]|uniref:Uncharacterized protein n=1 Tax=Sorghum bicolor TaxID=4558 RepID=A0A921PZ50_SORBI|nr:hypothetical protein BDA96_10G014000 [Sorghum bicolor]